MKNKPIFILVLISFSFSVSISARVLLPSIFSNGMVLQQQSDVSIWGTTELGHALQIKTSWDKKTYSVVADKDGRWKSKIKTPKAGGPYNIQFIDSLSEQTILENVYSGEVWICSGQSNMVINLKNVLNSESEIKDSNYPQIHFFRVPQNTSLTPVNDVKAVWESPNPHNSASYSAVAFFFARELYNQLKVPIGIIHSAYGSSTQEAWLSEEYISEVAYARNLLKLAREGKLDSKIKMQKVATSLYHAMFKPLVPFTVKGVCWYQGESNAQYPNDYELLLNNFIKSWRSELENPQLPFIICQISGYQTPMKAGWTAIQEIQYKISEKQEHIATVMTYDLGDSANIHPKNKQDVGVRIAKAARRLAYREDITSQGPVLGKYQFVGNKALLSFTNTASGLTLKNGGETVHNFMLAGEDKVFYPAIATLTSPSTIELSCSELVQPKYIRFAFESFNSNVNLYNSAGLPAVPFRTDDFK